MTDKKYIKSETKNWPHEIIGFLYKKYSETWTELNTFLYDELQLEKHNTTHKDKICELLEQLESKDYLKWIANEMNDKNQSINADYKNAFKNITTDGLDAARVEARLTLNGLDYAIKLEREKEQHDSILTTNESVRGTNTKTWVIASIAALFSMLTFFNECNEGCTVLNRQSQLLQDTLTKQLQDSSRQIRETFASYVHRLEDSLKKFSSKVDTPALKQNPVDNKNGKK